jgi:hypothetical protein
VLGAKRRASKGEAPAPKLHPSRPARSLSSGRTRWRGHLRMRRISERIPATHMRPSFCSPLLVTTGLDPVVHAEVRLRKAYRQVRSSFPSAWIAGSSPAMTKEKETKKKKGSGTPTDVYVQPPHLAMRRAPAGALAYRRSTTALAVRAFGPWAQLQARLPGTWQDVRSCKLAPTGEQRPRALTRALPAPACPSPGNAPPGPVVVPVSMMPEAARVRSVSFRPRAPHSLHLSEYLRDRRPW